MKEIAKRIFLYSKRIEMKTGNTPFCGQKKGSALQAHNPMKQKRVDYVIMRFKLHISSRSMACYISSTPQPPPADRITSVTLSQLSCPHASTAEPPHKTTPHFITSLSSNHVETLASPDPGPLSPISAISSNSL
jgi:hypothetical protein